MNKLIALAAAAIAASSQASAEPRNTASAKAEAQGTQPETVRKNGRAARVSRPVAGGIAPACPANIAREDCPRPARLKNVTEIAQILAD